MESLRATYGSDDDKEEEEKPRLAVSPEASRVNIAKTSKNKNGDSDCRDPTKRKIFDDPLPPPPLDLLRPPNSIDWSAPVKRIRRFQHVDGNYALHIYIPVLIPTTVRAQLASFVKKISSLLSGLYAVDIDFEVNDLCKDNLKLEEMLLGREFHISLGRTVPIQVHQIDSILSMLRVKLQSQRRFLIEFNRWEVFVNDEQARTFISLEVLGTGLSEITKQIRIVDQIYRLHGLPEFYKDPRPHISLIWALGNISNKLKQIIEKIDRPYVKLASTQKHIFMYTFNRIECKIGNKTYKICEIPD